MLSKSYPNLRGIKNYLTAPEQKKYRLLERLLRNRFSTEELEAVNQAFIYGLEAHNDSYRASGEPYIVHPLEVAIILAHTQLDCPTIVAAILHDVIEDTQVQSKDIENIFGQEILIMVDGLSKLDRLNFKSPHEAQRANYSKMFIAMANDIRLVFIKIADRLHNMRTIKFVNPAKAQRIALESLNIYVPLAIRLGMDEIRRELENICFKTLYPYRFKVLSARLEKTALTSKKILAKIADYTHTKLSDMEIESQIDTRTKSCYSCHVKMKEKNLKFKEINDINAMRIIVDTVDQCYRALGVIHTHYSPVPGKFKDYIAVAKFNGYQSLHTTIHVKDGIHLEVQIRTNEMHHFSKSGIAAHWMYKTNVEIREKAISQANAWIDTLASIARQPEKIRSEMMLNLDSEDDIYVFSKDNDPICLPANATVLDFAYAIHTDVGHSCIGAYVDKREAPLYATLRNGQSVSIIRHGNKATPDPNRLNYVYTNRARVAIIGQLNQLSTAESIALGESALNKSLRDYHLHLNQPAITKKIEVYAQELSYQSSEDLFQDIGLGNRLPQISAGAIADMVGASKRLDHTVKNALNSAYIHSPAIYGAQGMPFRFGECCYPIPDDEIVGIKTRIQGLIIHRKRCAHIPTSASKGFEILDKIAWGGAASSANYRCGINIIALDQKGALARISAAISNMDVNIVTVRLHQQTIEQSLDNQVLIPFVLDVNHRNTLARIIRSLHRIDIVQGVQRFQ